ncbi:MAG: prolyl oligopeptidase family serine peptidase, partial [Fimbriimonadales bacterium]
LSPDGKFLAWGTRATKGDPELHLVDLLTDRTTAYPRGTAPRFSDDGRYLFLTVVPLEADVEKAKKEKKKPEEMPKNSLQILDLSTGTSKTIERIQTYNLAEEGSTWISYRAEPMPAAAVRTPTPTAKPEGEQEPEKPVDPKPQKRRGHTVGRELTLMELSTGREIKLSDVSDFAWHKGGKVITYSTSTKDGAGDGIFSLEPGTGKATTIVEGMAMYKSLSVLDKGMVAFQSDARTYTEKVQSWDIYLWRPNQQPKMAVKADHDAFGEWEVTDRVGVRFSEEGERLLFSTREKPAEPGTPAEEVPADEKVNVDIWHWSDPLIQPMQLLRANGVRNKSYAAMLDIGSGRVMQLETAEHPSVSIADEGDGDVAIATNSEIYGPLVSYDETYSDYTFIDLRSGRRALLKQQSGDGVQMSPTGKWLSWWDSEKQAWFTRPARLEAEVIEASKGAQFPFFNEVHDSPSLAGSYGTMGWTTGEDRLLVYDNFDVWSLDPAGRREPVRLTRGRESGMRLRPLRIDPDERFWDITKPILFSATNDKTKATGYFERMPDGTLRELIYGDYRYSYSSKADDADVVIMTRQRFNEYPDIWTTNSKFENPRKRTNANPQMSEYLWGSSELVEWTSDDGVPLQGVLYKPENYDPTKKYPMIVYFYERLSQNLHTFYSPSPGSSSINIPFYVSRGYLVFTPDIPYEIGYPGESAESAIVPGVLSLINRGLPEPKRIAIQGHSWGGYQVCHLVTRTNLFAAAEAGAPVANMISAYGGIRWGSGMSRQFQYEKTQSRIGGTIWDKPLQFIENSPVFWADRVRTPLLLLHNDKDGSVPWYQGIEMYMALRRLNKPVWLFNYNEEDHGLARMANRKDWAIRMQQFFDHYLMDAPAPPWLTDGVPAINKGKDLGLGGG